MRNRGFTLTEIMVSMMVLTIISGVIFSFALAMGASVRTQESQVTASDDARLAMMRIVRDLRQAARRSIDWSALPATQISYRVAVDLDGNGLAVDQSGTLELSPVRTLRRDVDDLNGDGLTDAQLLSVEGDEVRVLANTLIPPAAQGNPQGLWFEQAGLGVRVTLRTERASSPQDPPMRVVLTEVITPRN